MLRKQYGSIRGSEGWKSHSGVQDRAMVDDGGCVGVAAATPYKLKPNIKFDAHRFI